MDPRKLDKYLYIRKTPTWFVRGFYALGLLTWFPVAYGFAQAARFDWFFQWVVGPMVLFLTVYYMCTWGMSMLYRQFDIKKHEALIRKFWNGRTEPTVDVFLPICGEDAAMLRNTWSHVKQLSYKALHVYVLDDSRTGCDEHKAMAREFGFTYLFRSNKGWMKKAGNLRHGFEHSSGDFIVVFDADFAPHPDFVRELTPYMQDPKVGIVQAPQYFDMSPEVHRASPVAYGAGQGQEYFYRFTQGARDRLGGAMCCGSNALFRRTALAQIGGMSLAEHCEDAQTGFDLTALGWIVRYVPVILAVGVCPDNAHAYFHQQHTWCHGCVGPMFTRAFWKADVNWKVRFSYLINGLYYLSNPLAILFTFQLFWTLFFYNPYITFAGSELFYPYMVWCFGGMLLFPISRFRWGVLYASFLQMFSFTHAFATMALKQTVGRVATNAKRAGVSSAFRQATWCVAAYLVLYGGLTGLAAYRGLLHPVDYNYFSIQFWLLYNLAFSSALLWQMGRTIVRAGRAARVLTEVR